MSRKLVSMTVGAVLFGGTAIAEVPSVAVDIAPVHSLVARVMDGLGTPELIVDPGATPHEYNLRPSDAAALEQAELVFWMGEDLTPWMTNAVATLSTEATVTALLEAEGTRLLEFREGALFEAHEHDDAHDEHAHDAKDGHDHDAHAHGGHDPHAWLSPDNAKAWLDVIAAQLSAADPGNADAYAANAATGRAEIDAVKAEVAAILDPVRGKRFLVFHDAYQYFETAFDFPAAGAISLSDASSPSPARIAEIRDRVREEGIDCVLTEPQFNAGLVATVLDGTEVGTGILDPLGSDIDPGADLYPRILRNLAMVLADCL